MVVEFLKKWFRISMYFSGRPKGLSNAECLMMHICAKGNWCVNNIHPLNDVILLIKNWIHLLTQVDLQYSYDITNRMLIVWNAHHRRIHTMFSSWSKCKHTYLSAWWGRCILVFYLLQITCHRYYETVSNCTQVHDLLLNPNHQLPP